MHILVLNEYFPPDRSATARMAQLVARSLACHHQVTVLAGRPSYETVERHPRYLLRREIIGNLIVERVGSTAFPRYRIAGRLSNYLSYLALAVPRALMLKPDVILAMTDPPFVGIAGALVARLKRRPFVYNIRDLYPDMALASGYLRPSPMVSLWERAHRWALHQAERVIVLGDDMKERVVAKGVDARRVEIVRDGAPIPAVLPNGNRDHPVYRAVRGDASFVLVHAGNLGFYGAWETLVAGAALLDGLDVGLTFIGDGAERHRLEGMARTCDRVRFIPYREPAEVPYVLAAADVHVVTVKRGLEGIVVPSKLYPILAAGRPVLAIAPDQSDVSRIVRETGCGVVADPDEPAAVAAAIRLLRQDPAELVRMGKRAAEAARRFEADGQLQRFAEVLETIPC